MLGLTLGGNHNKDSERRAGRKQMAKSAIC